VPHGAVGHVDGFASEEAGDRDDGADGEVGDIGSVRSLV
jgi:hypothetical protein